jgi:hypothetical protein
MANLKIKAITVKLEKYEKGESKPFETITHKVDLEKGATKDASN